MPEKLTPEQIKALMEIAKSPNTDQDRMELNDAERFALSLGIKNGEARVDRAIVWETYINWTESSISRSLFFRQFNQLFPLKRWGYGRLYLLEPDPFDLSAQNNFDSKRRTREQIEKAKRNRDRKKADKAQQN